MKIELSEKEINKISILGQAHVGDAVYELMVRTYLCTHDVTGAHNLHKASVAMVNAPYQAAAAEKLLPMLTEDELSVYKRGRNAKVNSIPQKATVGEYHSATGLEALFGRLYLSGQTGRLEELFGIITDEH